MKATRLMRMPMMPRPKAQFPERHSPEIQAPGTQIPEKLTEATDEQVRDIQKALT